MDIQGQSYAVQTQKRERMMKSRSKAVEDLMRQAKKIANTPDLLETLSELESEARDAIDVHKKRSIVLVASGLLENCLEIAISSKFVISNKKFKQKLFDGDHEREGILGTIYTRNIVARALDIYGDKTYQDVNTVRIVRNLYAHPKNPKDFEEDSLKALCKFNAVEKISAAFDEETKNWFEKMYSERPAIYSLTSFLRYLVPYLLLHQSPGWHPKNRQDWRQTFS